MEKLNLTEVEGSSQIAAAGYDESKGEFYVQFHSNPGVVYVYEGVPAKVSREFNESTSKGKFFHQKIRKEYPVKTIAV